MEQSEQFSLYGRILGDDSEWYYAKPSKRQQLKVDNLLGEEEGDKVAHVDGGGGRTTTRIQEERVALLVLIEDEVQVAVREEDAAS